MFKLLPKICAKIFTMRNATFTQLSFLLQQNPIKPILLNEWDLEEKFVKGSGPGGQKINKCRHCVQLKHLPTGIMVETQRFRELANNRKEARKLLKLQLDKLINGKDSKLDRKIQKARKANQKRKYRAKAKYGISEQESQEDKRNIPAISTEESPLNDLKSSDVEGKL